MVDLHVVGPSAWERQPDETPEEFALFCVWALSCPRVAPSREETPLALRNRWAERAAEFDTRISAPATPREKLQQVHADLLDYLQNEARKHRRLSYQRPDAPVSSIREAILIAHYMCENKAAINRLTGEDENVDLSRLTDEQLETLQNLQKTLRSA